MMHHPTNFIIISRGRAGSTWLATSLNNHSMIHCGGELRHIFVNAKQKNYKKLLVKAGPYGINAPFRGFKFIYTLIGKLGSKRCKRNLDIIDEFNPIILLLDRRNMLEHFLSSRLAHRARCFIMMSNDPEKLQRYNEPIVLSIDEFDWFRRSQVAWRRFLRERYPDAIELWYEDLKEAGVEGVVKEFGLEVEEFPETTVVLRRKTKRDLIINYDEVLDYLQSIGERSWIDSKDCDAFRERLVV